GAARRRAAGGRPPQTGTQGPPRPGVGCAPGSAGPAAGARLVVAYEEDALHTAWLRIRPVLLLVLVVLALPGRRRRVDDDLPDEPRLAALPPQRGPAEASESLRPRPHRSEDGRPDPVGADPDTDPVRLSRHHDNATRGE
ncbi:hypothetical protein, partial [Streptomyces sp. NPDC058953]|uniref:hypothetical protein n=1 Tax=Streptomyces sp. NPDC058953 TaxID=3346676 RepID=UPI0036A0DB7D